MKRRYRAAGFLERCRRLRDALDRPALTTDVIVGFPGETEADFQETCRVAREAGFARIHVFPFSARSGTPAADYPDRIPPPVVAERRVRLEELGRELMAAYCRSLVGRRLEVLVEGAALGRPGHVTGTACRYVPVAFEGHAGALLGRLVPVRASEFAGGTLLARPDSLSGLEAEPLARADNLPGRRIALPLWSGHFVTGEPVRE
jgi:threonylcarbamoyladenosine tRNA methylthiotransferase MtaB